MSSSRFEVRETLGEGGSGRVLRALDRLLGIEVAMKRLGTEALAEGEDLRHELRTLAHFSHPHVVTVYELLEDEEGHFVTMELVVDTKEVQAPGPWPQERVVRVFGQVASALSSLHQVGIVHGDVKPHNVLVSSEGRTVLTDFGLSVRPGAAAPQGLSPRWAAPEVVRGQRPGPASDMYSLGVMLHDALSAEPAFQGSAAQVMLLKSAEPEALVLDAGPVELAALVTALTQADAARRPTAHAVARQLGTSGAVPPWAGDRPIVGRDREVAQLLALHGQSSRFRHVVLVSAPSGVGKSTLISAFAARVQAPLLRFEPNERVAGSLVAEVESHGFEPVLVVDDVQFGDDASLTRLLRHVDQPAGRLLVMASRPEPSPERRVRALLADLRHPMKVVVLPLEALGFEPLAEQIELARSLLGAERDLLELLAASDAPVPMPVILRAPGIEAGHYLTLIHALKVRRLVKTALGVHPEVALAHDAVAAAVGVMPEALRRLAEAFARSEGVVGRYAADIGVATALWRLGDKGAIEPALRAADEALRQGEAEREATLLSMVISLVGDDPRRATWSMRASEARLRAGQLVSAARGLLEAGGEADRRQALEAFLFGGAYTEGRALLDALVRERGLPRPGSFLTTVARVLIWYRTAEGKTLPRRKTGTSREGLDILHAASLGFAMFEPLTSTWYQVAHMRAALGSVDDFARARALAIHLVHCSTSFLDPRRPEITERRIAEALNGLEAEQRADLMPLISSSRGAAAWVVGDLERARTESLAAVEAASRPSAVSRTWVRDSSLLVACAAAEERGDWAELAALTDDAMRDATRRGDRYLQLCLRARSMSFLRLVQGEPEAAVEAARWALEQWSGESGIVRFSLYLTTVRAALYRGDVERAHHEAEAGVAPLARAFLTQSHYHAGHIHYARMQAALALMASSSGLRRWRLGRLVRGLAARVRKQSSQTHAAAVGALEELATGASGEAAVLYRGAGLHGLADLVSGETEASARRTAEGVVDPVALRRALALSAGP